MRENYDRRKKHPTNHHELVSGSGTPDWGRLEDVGDLHFHGSSHTTALDYYCQLLDEDVFPALSFSMALRVLQKAIDANLALDKLDDAEELLLRAEACIREAAHAEELEDLGVVQAMLMSRRSTILRERGQLHDALQIAKRAFSVLALTDEHAEVARLQVAMGICHIRLGRQEKAEEFFTDGLSTYRRIGNDAGVANLMNNLALLNKNKCRWEKALSLIEKAVDMGSQMGASHLLPTYFLNQGIILIKIDRLGEARSSLDKGLRLASSLGAKLAQARLYLALGRLETMAGRLARAEEHILAGKNLAEQYRYSRETIIADEYLGDILLARGEVGKARFNYHLGLEKSRSIASNNDLEGELLRRIGEVERQSCLLDEAVATTQAAIAVCESCGEIYELGFCHLTLGNAYAGKADSKQAEHHFREAIGTFQSQNLLHMWCQAILEFTEACLEKSNEASLLLLRRYLMDAQENGASSVSDTVLCRILNRLAEVQIRLGQYDDALLTVFELERHVSGLDDSVLSRSVVELRDRIDGGLLGGIESTEGHLQAISSIPGLLTQDDPAVPQNLEAVLAAGMERVEANAGFIAMADDSSAAFGMKITSRKGLTGNLAEQLTRWFDNELDSGRRIGTSLFSRLDESDDIAQAIPALLQTTGSCVLMPISLHDKTFGLLFLAKDSNSIHGFDRSSLDFLSTYMGFLALFLFEKGQTATLSNSAVAGSNVVASPMARINSFENIITQNVKMLQVLSLARKVAPSNLTVLLGGETGTGKGLLAYAIHGLSKRSEKKFMAINCAAIPESLLESELFGHVKGSFTGANKDKIGLLEEAEGGTVFLDEVGKMPLGMQGKLLHFLDSKTIRPVGSNQDKQIDVRIVCASKADLHQMAMNGNFLDDLYYRLLDFPLVIPPLRERADDIALLVRHFVDRFSTEIDVQTPMVSHGFMEVLGQHNWPGNVRELEKNIKRAIVLAQDDGVLRVDHLPEGMAGTLQEMAEGEVLPPLKETLADIECREISRALRLAGGNKSQASRMLQISYPNLLKKIRHYGIVSS